MLINKEWLRVSKEARSILDKDGSGEDITVILQEAHDEMVLIVQMLPSKLVESDIPVDVDGYTTSKVLKLYGTSLALCKLFMGWTGSGRANSADIYGSTFEWWCAKAKSYEAMISEDTVKNNDTEEIIEDPTTNMIAMVL